MAYLWPPPKPKQPTPKPADPAESRPRHVPAAISAEARVAAPEAQLEYTAIPYERTPTFRRKSPCPPTWGDVDIIDVLEYLREFGPAGATAEQLRTLKPPTPVQLARHAAGEVAELEDFDPRAGDVDRGVDVAIDGGLAEYVDVDERPPATKWSAPAVRLTARGELLADALLQGRRRMNRARLEAAVKRGEGRRARLRGPGGRHNLVWPTCARRITELAFTIC